MPSLPAALTRIDDEPIEFLKKFKASRLNKWKLTRAALLYDAAQLCYYLIALDRNAEAAEIAAWVTGNVTFDGNYDIWTPVRLCSAALYQARLRLGDPTGAREATEPLRENSWYLVNLMAKEENDIQLVEEGLHEGISFSRLSICTALHRILPLQAAWDCGLVDHVDYSYEQLLQLRDRALAMLALLAEPTRYAAYLKGRQRPQAPPDSPFSSAGESNKVLLKFKKEREGKWRFDNRMLTDDAADLACMLYALDRTAEARAVVNEAMAHLAAPNVFDTRKLRVMAAYLDATDRAWEKARATLLPIVTYPYDIVPKRPSDLDNPDWYLNYVTNLLNGIREKQIKASPAKQRMYLLTALHGTMDSWLRAQLHYSETSWFPVQLLESQLAEGKALLLSLL